MKHSGYTVTEYKLE